MGVDAQRKKTVFRVVLTKQPSNLASFVFCSSFFCSQLPGYRGAVVFIRLINDDRPLGVTCHWALPKVDVGPIVSKQALPVYRPTPSINHWFCVLFDDGNSYPGDKLSDVMHGIVTLASRLMTQAIACASGPGGVASVMRIDQGAGAGDTPCFRWPEDELVAGTHWVEHASACARVCSSIVHGSSAERLCVLFEVLFCADSVPFTVGPFCAVACAPSTHSMHAQLLKRSLMKKRMGRTVESSRTALAAKTTEVSILQLYSISFSAVPAATNSLGGNLPAKLRGVGGGADLRFWDGQISLLCAQHLTVWLQPPLLLLLNLVFWRLACGEFEG
jgi:hypothetical protein